MATGHLIRYKSALVAAAAVVAAILCVTPAHAAAERRLDLSLPKIVFAIYGEHVSHISQHQPFAADPSEYGYNTISVSVTFESHGNGGPFLTLADGYNLTSDANVWCRGKPISGDPGMYEFHRLQYYGALGGPREVFAARFGWRWIVH